jgi:hypothetical protein
MRISAYLRDSELQYNASNNITGLPALNKSKHQKQRKWANLSTRKTPTICPQGRPQQSVHKEDPNNLFTRKTPTICSQGRPQQYVHKEDPNNLFTRKTPTICSQGRPQQYVHEEDPNNKESQ